MCSAIFQDLFPARRVFSLDRVARFEVLEMMARLFQQRLFIRSNVCDFQRSGFSNVRILKLSILAISLLIIGLIIGLIILLNIQPLGSG